MMKVNFTPYTSRPLIGATTGLVLSVRLLRVAKTKAIPANVILALTEVHTAAEQLRLAVRARLRRSVGSRPADRIFDSAWGGLYTRTEAWARQIGQPEAARAQALLDGLFVAGLSFLAAKHEQEWVHSRELLERIDEEGLATEIDDLAGPRFLELVREAHDGLGVALGLNGEAPISEPVLSVGEAINALAWAIANYARVFAGIVVDEESLALFQAAMKPLEEHRSTQRRSGGSTGSDGAEGEDEGEDEDAFDEDEDFNEDAFDEEFDLDEPLPSVVEEG